VSIATYGIAAGLAGALLLTRVMRSLLFGVGSTDAVTYLGVVLLVLGTALLACYVPARRAAHLDPVQTLK
jgi:ABC-type lipoprotein release transport system permease subunit